MGNFAYCKICNIPVKDFDCGDYLICGHSNREADYSVWYSTTDDLDTLKSWNDANPDRPVDDDLVHAHIPSPYMDEKFRPKNGVKK